MIADHLNALESPDHAEFYTSGRTSNEAAFLYQLFVRRFGTNNFPDCSNMCHEATSVGLPESIGIGKGTVLLEDFDATGAIFVIGQNPGTNSPRMMTSLRNASRRGVPIVAINPLRERALERFAAPQDSDRDGHVQLDPDRQRVLPGQSRRRRRRPEGHHEAGARCPRRSGRCRPPSRCWTRHSSSGHTDGFEALADGYSRRTSWDDILRVRVWSARRSSACRGSTCDAKSVHHRATAWGSPSTSRARTTSSRSPICC